MLLGSSASGLRVQMASLGFIAHFTTEEIGETEHSGLQLVNLIVKTGCNKQKFREEGKRGYQLNMF